MSIQTRPFGHMPDGEPVAEYILTNQNGLTATFLDLGGIWRQMLVPDREGRTADVVLGYDTVEAYLADLERLFLGEAFDAVPTKERRVMAESYLTALDCFSGDPARSITLRVKCRQRMEQLRHHLAMSNNPYWNGVCERIASRDENTEAA